MGWGSNMPAWASSTFARCLLRTDYALCMHRICSTFARSCKHPIMDPTDRHCCCLLWSCNGNSRPGRVSLQAPGSFNSLILYIQSFHGTLMLQIGLPMSVLNTINCIIIVNNYCMYVFCRPLESATRTPRTPSLRHWLWRVEWFPNLLADNTGISPSRVPTCIWPFVTVFANDTTSVSESRFKIFNAPFFSFSDSTISLI